MEAKPIHEVGSGQTSTVSNQRCLKCGLVRFGQPHCECDSPEWEFTQRHGNHHPTVKPVSLMRWLVRLIAEPGATVLDPFMGSGTTGVACAMEGREFVGIERESEYLEIAKARIDAHERQGVLV